MDDYWRTKYEENEGNEENEEMFSKAQQSECQKGFALR